MTPSRRGPLTASAAPRPAGASQGDGERHHVRTVNLRAALDPGVVAEPGPFPKLLEQAQPGRARHPGWDGRAFALAGSWRRGCRDGRAAWPRGARRSPGRWVPSRMAQRASLAGSLPSRSYFFCLVCQGSLGACWCVSWTWSAVCGTCTVTERIYIYRIYIVLLAYRGYVKRAHARARVQTDQDDLSSDQPVSDKALQADPPQ